MMPATVATPYTRGDVLMQIDHVSLAYGPRVVLRDVCAEIRDIVRPACPFVTGQIICFLGPSGIGKTQLSRVIAGLQKPTSGTVSLSCGASPSYREWVAPGAVGMVPQNYPLFEFATVEENLKIAGRQAGLTPKQVEEKANEYIIEFDLHEHLYDYPRALSGGTRQRVAIIRQLMCAGHYLVMDEPFSGLDPLMKRKASELIVKVANHDERNTIIIVTHDVTEGCAIADTVWLMGREQGELGSRLVKQYDLAEMGLAWREHPTLDHDFIEFVSEVKGLFPALAAGVLTSNG